MALRIFVSYSSINGSVAAVVTDRLRSNGYEVFFAEWNLNLGAQITPVLEQRIKQCEIFLVLLSNAARVSAWVMQEIGIAKASGRIILPVVLERGAEPSGFIHDQKYLPAYENFPTALAHLETSLRAYAQEKQQRQAILALKQKQNNEAALVALGIASIILLAVGGSK
jgi:hypothetical protein